MASEHELTRKEGNQDLDNTLLSDLSSVKVFSSNGQAVKTEKVINSIGSNALDVSMDVYFVDSAVVIISLASKEDSERRGERRHKVFFSTCFVKETK